MAVGDKTGLVVSRVTQRKREGQYSLYSGSQRGGPQTHNISIGLEMQILGAHSRLRELETLGVRASICFNEPLGDFDVLCVQI